MENKHEIKASFEMLETEAKTVAMADIIENSIQPPIRSAAISGLHAMICASKYIVPPVVWFNRRTKKYVICDGHRRFAVAKDLGVSMLPVLIIAGSSPEEWFVRLNRGARGIRGQDWLHVWASSYDNNPKTKILDEMPCGAAKSIRAMLDIWPRERVLQMGRDGRQSPRIEDSVRLAESMMRTYRLDCPPRSRTGDWVINHAAQRALIELNKGLNSKKAKRLLNCIQSDRPLFKRKRAKLMAV